MRINRRSQEFRKLATHGIGLEYASQLSHYEAIARDAGVTVHAVALAAFDSRSFRVELIPHEEEPTLAEELRKACASFWDDFVLKGRLPPRLPEDLPLEPTPMAEATVFRLAALKAVMDALENARQAMTEDLQDLYAGTTGALATGLATYSRKRSWDADTLRALAGTASIDIGEHTVLSGSPDQAQSTAFLERIAGTLRRGDRDGLRALLTTLRNDGMPEARSLDTDSLARALHEAGIETSPAERESVRFALSRRRVHSEALGELRLDAERVREGVCEYLDEMAEGALAPAEEAENHLAPT